MTKMMIRYLNWLRNWLTIDYTIKIRKMTRNVQEIQWMMVEWMWLNVWIDWEIDCLLINH